MIAHEINHYKLRNPNIFSSVWSDNILYEASIYRVLQKSGTINKLIMYILYKFFINLNGVKSYGFFAGPCTYVSKLKRNLNIYKCNFQELHDGEQLFWHVEL